MFFSSTEPISQLTYGSKTSTVPSPEMQDFGPAQNRYDSGYFSGYSVRSMFSKNRCPMFEPNSKPANAPRTGSDSRYSRKPSMGAFRSIVMSSKKR